MKYFYSESLDIVKSELELERVKSQLEELEHSNSITEAVSFFLGASTGNSSDSDPDSKDKGGVG